VINQTYSEWELIIGINGHPPNSDVYKRAKAFEEVSSKIRVIDFDFHTIKGKSNTLNEMLQYCQYEYVALLDVDDIWHHSKLLIQSIYLNKYDVICSQCVYFGDKEGVIPFVPTGDFSQNDFFLQNPIINSSSVIRKKYCHWDSRVDGIEDYDLWLRLRYIENCSFYNYNSVLVKHRIHSSSAFNSNKNDLGVPALLSKYKQYREYRVKSI
jgi:glycosyltransferase involved in cell wall biosynthesis